MGLCSKPKTPGPSTEEIALASVAAADFKRFEAKGLPLEAFAVEESVDPNVRRAIQSVLSGRGNADTAMAEAQEIQSAKQAAGVSGTDFASGSNMSALSAAASRAGVNQAKSAVAGGRQARDLQDRMQLTALQSGAGFAQNTDGGLAASARQANSRVLTEAQGSALQNQARTGALASVLEATGSGLWYKYGKKTPDIKAAEYETSVRTADGDQIGRIDNRQTGLTAPPIYDVFQNGKYDPRQGLQRFTGSL